MVPDWPDRNQNHHQPLHHAWQLEGEENEMFFKENEREEKEIKIIDVVVFGNLIRGKERKIRRNI